MECFQAKELLSQYLDKALDAQTNKAIEEHLLLCKGCVQELASLKACVSCIGSLREVKAPDDFLASLHKRMERRSEFNRIMRKLFVPAKVKIPLEFVGVLVSVVLVIAVYRLIQPIEHTPGISTPVIAAKPQELVSKLKRDDKYLGMRGSEELKMRGASWDADMLQSAGQAFGRSAVPMGVSSDTKGFRAATVLSDQLTQSSESLSQGRRALGLGLPAHNIIFLTVKHIVESLKGSLIFIRVKEDTGLPEAISAKIPRDNYLILLEKLKEVGVCDISSLPPAANGEDTMEVTIKLTPSS
jgi:hypothetical protein